MPVFSYKCRSCGNCFDVLTGSADKSDQKACTQCGSQDTEKSFSSFSFKANVEQNGPCGSGGCGSCGL